MAYAFNKRFPAIVLGAAAISGDTGQLKVVDLGNMPLGGDGVLTFTVKNTHATTVFDAFQVQVKTAPGADWELIASTAAEFTSAIVAPIRNSSASPVTLAAGAQMTFSMDVDGYHAVRLMASGDAAGTVDVSVGVR